MGALDGARYLTCNSECLRNGQRAARQPLRQRFAVHELHHQSVRSVPLFKAIDGRDVRMLDRRQCSRFAFESDERV